MKGEHTVFIVIGILSILAGCFVFNQAFLLIRLAQFAGSSTTIGSLFVIVALGLILAGAFEIASQGGQKRGFLRVSLWCYGGAFLAAVTRFNYGDFGIWAVLSALMVIVLSIWLGTHKRVDPQEETIEYIDPDRVRDNQKDV